MKKVLLSVLGLSAAFMSAQTWQPMDTNAPGLHFVNVLKMVDANTIWFSDTPAAAATDQNDYIGLSIDGGANWTNVQITGMTSGATIGDLHPVSSTTAYLVSSGSGLQNGIWKTTNAGVNWTRQTTASYSNGESFSNVVHFWDENNGFSAGDPIGAGANRKFEMYKTSNGGTNWTLVTTAPAPASGEYGYTGKLTANGDNLWLGTNLGRVLYSPDRGTSWQSFQTPAIDFGGVTSPSQTAEVAFRNSTNGLIITNDGTTGVVLLFSTSNSGSVWSDPMEPTGVFYGSDIEYVPGTANMYVTSSGDGSAVSKDGGLTWTDIASDPTYYSYKGNLSFLSSSVGFAGGVAGAVNTTTSLPFGEIFKLQGDLNLAVKETAVKSTLSVYPNPASDIVNLKSNKAIKYVGIIDATGKIVKYKLPSTNIDVSSLAKGIYIIQAAYEDGSYENTKLIKK